MRYCLLLLLVACSSASPDPGFSDAAGSGAAGATDDGIQSLFSGRGGAGEGAVVLEDGGVSGNDGSVSLDGQIVSGKDGSVSPDGGLVSPDGGAVEMPPTCTLVAPEPDCECAVHEGKEYFFCSGAKDWQAARVSCMDAMMDLVAIESAEEQAFLAENVMVDSWLGTYGHGVAPGVYSWDWVTGDELTYDNWAPGEPILMPGLCARMTVTSAQWQASSCAGPFSYICEEQ